MKKATVMRMGMFLLLSLALALTALGQAEVFIDQPVHSSTPLINVTFPGEHDQVIVVGTPSLCRLSLTGCQDFVTLSSLQAQQLNNVMFTPTGFLQHDVDYLFSITYKDLAQNEQTTHAQFLVFYDDL